MGFETPISQEARALRTALEESLVGFSYYDSADKLRFWNRAYEKLNFRIRSMIREGVAFADLLAALIMANQIDFGEEEHRTWIETRLMQRRYGATAIRRLTNGQTFLVQERKDTLGGTLGFWLDISDLIDAGAHMTPSTVVSGGDAPLGDPGPQAQIRQCLQTVLGNLEMLEVTTSTESEHDLAREAMIAAQDIGRVIDHERRRS